VRSSVNDVTGHDRYATLLRIPSARRNVLDFNGAMEITATTTRIPIHRDGQDEIRMRDEGRLMINGLTAAVIHHPSSTMIHPPLSFFQSGLPHRRLAASRHCTLEEFIKEVIEQLGEAGSTHNALLGMFADEPELMVRMVESAMQARADHPQCMICAIIHLSTTQRPDRSATGNAGLRVIRIVHDELPFHVQLAIANGGQVFVGDELNPDARYRAA
jgi:hypothetical protein